MNNADNKPNKSKLLFGIGTSILFVILGIYLFSTKTEQIDSSGINFRKIIGVACILLFGIIALLNLKKLFTNQNAN